MFFAKMLKKWKKEENWKNFQNNFEILGFDLFNQREFLILFVISRDNTRFNLWFFAGIFFLELFGLMGVFEFLGGNFYFYVNNSWKILWFLENVFGILNERFFCFVFVCLDGGVWFFGFCWFWLIYYSIS